MFDLNKLTADVKVDEYFEKYVDVERFQNLCHDCEHYGANWSCPPYDFDIEDYWKSFENLKLIAFKFDFNTDVLNTTYSERELDFLLKKFERFKVRLMNDIYALEDEDSVALFIGRCNLCMRCTREFGMQCKMPFKLRYSIESLGGNVDQSVEDIFGYKILYAQENKLPEYLIFVGGLLYGKK